jgi:hypothetical protein
MGWKDWPNWFKGAIVVEVIFICVFVLSVFLSGGCFGVSCNFPQNGSVSFSSALLFISSFPGIFLENTLFFDKQLLIFPEWFPFTVNLIYYFLIGALIGLIVGKNK